MRIVQSYWTKPTLKRDNTHNADRNKGGWPEIKYNYFSWAFSCLTLRSFYREVELYTDGPGHELLIEKLGLPYTKVHVVLDALNQYSSDLWALGKVYTYGLQETPFLHVDGDIFIWDRFGPHLLQSNLIAQNPEAGFEYYQNTYNELATNCFAVPEVLRCYLGSHSTFNGINAGILGGNDLSFINQYAHTALRFVDENVALLAGINTGLFNNFYEQCLFKVMADVRGVPISYLKGHVNDRFDGLMDLTGSPANSWFHHAVGVYKKRPETGALLAFHLQKRYPGHYYRIINLFRSHAI